MKKITLTDEQFDSLPEEIQDTLLQFDRVNGIHLQLKQNQKMIDLSMKMMETTNSYIQEVLKSSYRLV